MDAAELLLTSAREDVVLKDDGVDEDDAEEDEEGDC